MAGEDGRISVTFVPRTVRFDCSYYKGKDFTLIFHNVAAYRYRRTPYATRWHWSNTIDQLVEIGNSQWTKELLADRERPVNDQPVVRHFMFNATDHGFYEVLAEGYETQGAKPLQPSNQD